ncbi:MAG: PilZ domain-containing protein, partial [Deltaproteobacteria bacterium]|nr:PilZ domain-containing protein [Deltaproteobacteria bacterium]
NEVGVEARYNTRTDATLKIRFKDVDQLTAVYTHDISAGGLFMITDRDFTIGTQIQIDAVHPRTGESFPMMGAIRWMGVKEGQRGAGVELVLLEDDERSDFWKFVNHGGLTDILS